MERERKLPAVLNINLPTRDEVSKRFRESPLAGRVIDRRRSKPTGRISVRPTTDAQLRSLSGSPSKLVVQVIAVALTVCAANGVVLPPARPPIGTGRTDWGSTRSPVSLRGCPCRHQCRRHTSWCSRCARGISAGRMGSRCITSAQRSIRCHRRVVRLGATGNVSADARSRGIELQRKPRAGPGCRRSCGFVTRCARLAIDGRHDSATRPLVLKS